MPAPAFQALTIAAKGRLDRIITAVRISQVFDPAAPPTPLPTPMEAKALWDTGATKSAISPSVVASLGLVPVGMVNVSHAQGTAPSPTYLVNFILPNEVQILGGLVTEFQGNGFDAIIGMDVITLGDFSITNVGGETKMSFRTPSCVAIDYVADHNKILFSGVGRNDPCPCGQTSGAGKRLKFKHCHGH